MSNLYKWHAVHAKPCCIVCFLWCNSYSVWHFLLYIFEFVRANFLLVLCLTRFGKQYDNFWVVISLASPLSHSSNLTGCSFNRFALVLSVKKRWRCHWCSLSKLIQPVNLCWLASMNPVGWYGWETAAAILHPFSLKQFTSFLRHQYSASTKYFVPISGWQDLYIWNKYSSTVLFPQSRSRDWERST